jgi:hypothetical protein
MTKERPMVEDVYGHGVKEGRRRVLYLPGPASSSIPLDSPEWFAWLEAASTTSFSYSLFDAERGYIVGFMTVSKERRQRGGLYWRVVRRVGGRVRKVYLGRTAVVTDARLAAIADSFRDGGDRSSWPEDVRSAMDHGTED